MFGRLTLCAVAALMLFSGRQSRAAELKAESLAAWNAYVAGKQAAIECSEFHISGTEDAEELRHGAIEVYPVKGHGVQTVPFALIHDWVGTVFIPGTSLEEVLKVVRSYGEYPTFYKPAVAQAKILATSAQKDHYSIVMRQDVLTIRTGLVGDYMSEYHRVDPTHFYSTTRSQRLREILKYGSEEERLLDPDQGNGFIWRIYSEARYEQADGGVYLQLEGVALSRTVPHAFAWLVNPLVERMSRAALATTLRQTRAAVQSSEKP